MTDGTLYSTILLETRLTPDQAEQHQALLQVAFHVKRQRGTSTDLLQLAEMLGLADVLAEHRSTP
jgi:hypothetical protein